MIFLGRQKGLGYWNFPIIEGLIHLTKQNNNLTKLWICNEHMGLIQYNSMIDN